MEGQWCLLVDKLKVEIVNIVQLSTGGFAKTIGLDFAKTPRCAPLCPIFGKRVKQLLTMDSLNYNARIDAIITVLESQERVNYAATIRDSYSNRRYCGGDLSARRGVKRRSRRLPWEGRGGRFTGIQSDSTTQRSFPGQ
jgi:hypothetical protein